MPEDVLPFEPGAEPTCVFGGASPPGSDIDISVDVTAMTLDLEGPGFSVSIDPGQEGTFTATSGPHAGSYRARNDEISNVMSGSGPYAILNFGIARAP